MSEAEFIAKFGDKANEIPDVDLVKFLNKTHAKWLEPQKTTPNKPAVILSQKLFFARNIKKYPFLENTTISEKENIYRDISKAIKKTKIFPLNNFVEIRLDGNSPLINVSLFERDIISASAAHSDKIKGIFTCMDGNEFPVILANTQNHLDITIYCDNGKEMKALGEINKIDNVLGEELLYAYDSHLGFLSSKPEECGCGFSMETVLHLPGLVMTEEIKETFNGLTVLGAKIEGMFGNEDDCWGAFFRLTTGNYSGYNENEIIQKTKEIQKVLYSAEQKARKRLFKEAGKIMEDKVYRSFGMLKYARTLPISQFLNFISMLRIGCEYNIIPLNIEFLNTMLEKGFFANMLFLFLDKEAKIEFFDEERANLSRLMLKPYNF